MVFTSPPHHQHWTVRYTTIDMHLHLMYSTVHSASRCWCTDRQSRQSGTNTTREISISTFHLSLRSPFFLFIQSLDVASRARTEDAITSRRYEKHERAYGVPQSRQGCPSPPSTFGPCPTPSTSPFPHLHPTQSLPIPRQPTQPAILIDRRLSFLFLYHYLVFVKA